jgi:putative transcriptional regulator
MRNRRKLPLLKIPPNAKRPKFKEYRHSMGSQREVGEVIGVTEASVRQTESGRMTPTLLTAFKYAIYFGCTVEELFPDLMNEAKQCVR